ncbi:hypothetical protein GSY71_11260 [Pusillimonas sp. TS35]|uniref:sigma-E factor negative regulatory protein n=1 Tax=Paracandidimonas lactea TaxID=2895524 RepID=UPI00136FB903|nr:sigma-E factor negative regulatory protein [Paracandidimonas lactea]MYN13713.1 hypothetical protein [Pusillimonas sp. TS35]
MQAAQQHIHDQETSGWEASISGWVDGDGEIRPEELDTPYGRQLWETYHLIGDTLRNPDLAIKPSDRFYARVSAAIDAEPHIVAPRLARHHHLRLGLSGLAVAAAVASVVWVALPYLAGSEAPTNVQVMANAGEEAGLGDYLYAHQELAGAGPARRVSFEVSR